MIEKDAEVEGAHVSALENDALYILGKGSGNYGYGQNFSISSLSGQDIHPQSLTKLREMLNRARKHQLGNDTGFGVIAPTIISGTEIIAANYKAFKDAIATIETDRLRFGMASMTVTGNLHTSMRSSKWGPRETITTEIDITWASEDQCRWFFNSGGEIRLNFAHPTNNTRHDRGWNRSLARIGTISFAAMKTTGTSDRGKVVGNVGYYQTDGNYKMIFDGTSIDDTFDYMDPRYRPGTYPFKDDFYVRVKRYSTGIRVLVELREKNDWAINSGTNVKVSAMYATKHLRDAPIRLPSIRTAKAF